jgi:hypothetical protein
MQVYFDLHSVESYRQFLAIKQLPMYSIRGRVASFPDEYANRLGIQANNDVNSTEFSSSDFLFDYQAAISSLAIRKRKFAVFMDCGLGKTLIIAEFARHCLALDKKILIVSPLMVIPQTMAEIKKFYDDALPLKQIATSELNDWLSQPGAGIGITNWEAMRDDLVQGHLDVLIGDETSMLKSHYGKWGRRFIDLGRGLEWKLCCTGTPAPNDRIEYANHAVFLDQFPTVNAFLARYFVNRGQTMERWELKPHALRPFYRALSHWCIFVTDPSVYGWHDNTESVPPIHVHIHDVPLSVEQEQLVRDNTGSLINHRIGGITSRTRLATLAKGYFKGQSVPTNKTAFIRSLVDQWPNESTIIWCLYNEEQEIIGSVFPDAASITGTTKNEDRLRLIEDFKAGRRKVLISKPKILGFGLNLQIATRQVFSGLQDSYESYYQAVKRSNRYGSTFTLNVHIPVTDIERPMIETVLRKAARVQADSQEQEKLFRSIYG